MDISAKILGSRIQQYKVYYSYTDLSRDGNFGLIIENILRQPAIQIKEKNCKIIFMDIEKDSIKNNLFYPCSQRIV